MSTPQLDSEKVHLSIVKGITTWGEAGNGHNKQSHICFAMDSYAVMDCISKDLTLSMGLKPCMRKKHNHRIPGLEAAGRAPLTTYGTYHLRCAITDRTGRQLSFTRPFVAIDRDPADAPILLGRPALQDYKIALFNATAEWEFEQEVEIKEYSASRFRQMVQKESAQVYEIQPRFRPPPLSSGHKKKKPLQVNLVTTKTEPPYRPPGLTVVDESDDDQDPAASDLSSVPEWMQQRYADVLDNATHWVRAPHRPGIDLAIDLQPGSPQPPFLKMYNISPRESDALEEWLTEHLAKGHVRESISPAGAPVVFSPKKNGVLRVCIDYRKLNAMTIKNRYPLPLIGELLDRLNGAKIFSKIDLKDGYYHIRIKEGDEWKTAFRTRFGHYEFTVMPFGLSNAPATFQNYINNALRGYTDDFCIVYLDDILVFSKTTEEHDQHLGLIMERLRQAELFVNPKKSKFYKTEVEYLGYIIDSKGVRMDPSRVDAIIKWKEHPPKTYRDIQVFIGFCNFYRRFIYGFSKIARPILLLLKGMKKGRKPGLIGHHWQEPQQRAFEELIDQFTTAPLLRHYDRNLPLRLETDASQWALAGIISQPFKDQWHPIAFFSRRFTEAEINYQIYDKEMLAIVASFDHWRHYLDGAIDTEVYTDHQNLKKFMEQTQLNGRQTRWLIKLLPYDFRIFYRKGLLNPADAPSRRPDYLDGSEEVGCTPVSTLLPTLREKIALHDNLDKQLGKVDTHPEHTPHTETTQAKPKTKMVPPLDVSPIDKEAQRNLQVLRLQAVTRREVQEALSDASQEKPLTDDLIAFIKKCQEVDPYCKWVARQNLHYRSQLLDTSVNGKTIVPEVTRSTIGKEVPLLCLAGRVIVPEQMALRHELLRLFHDCPSSGHWGEQRTKEILQRSFYWPGLGHDVKEWISVCPQCQGKAIHHHKPYGHLEPYVPEDGDYRPFKHISLDWITGLPESRRRSTGEEFNSILTVVCRNTKAVRFIPTRDDTTAADFARVFFEHVECEYGTPVSIVSDRDSRITSEFWKEVCSYQMIKRRLSTAYHPQTDGQSEALNRIVEDYLRAYCADEPSSWVNLLPLARFAYNNSVNAATKTSPHNLLFGMDCSIRFHLDSQLQGRVPEARARIEKLHELRGRLRTHLAEANERMTRYYNQKHVPKQFTKGQLVKLSTKNLRLQHAKLAPRWIGPFRVLERIGGQAYRLALPDKYSRLHDVFPVQFLEDYNHRQEGGKFLPMPDLQENQEEWEVQEVKGSKDIKGIHHYLVKWSGWPSEYDTWEPVDHLKNASKKIQEWERQTRKRRHDKLEETSDSEAGQLPRKRKRS